MEKKSQSSEVLIKPSVFKKMGLNHPLLEFRTPFDRSQYSSLENIIRGTLKSFALTYGGKVAINLIMALLKIKQTIKNPLVLLKALFNLDNLKFGLFLGSYTAIMKSLITIARILRKKDDGWNGFVAFFIAGWISFFFFNKTSRVFIACLMLSRAFDCVYNSLINNKIIKPSPYHYVFIFATLNSLTGYAFAHEKYLQNPSMNNFGHRMTQQHSNDLILTELWHEITRRNLVRKGIIKEPYLISY